ncbi:MAG: GNAT family N-acetyltransferase, partial [Beijerinckiaceae bacterium]
MAADLSQWKARPRPQPRTLDGAYARLEPLDPARHGDDLFAISSGPGTEERFRYLFDVPPQSRAALDPWLDAMRTSGDPMFWVVVDKATGKAGGRQALMRIDPAHGVIEIGSILWGAPIARSRVATEALYLFAAHAFDELGYRRFEWKCDNANMPSKRAAERFGFTFEGVFRQHMVVKGKNRDTAWFSMTDAEWPA